MNEDVFYDCYSGEVHEINLKSYPGEKAVGVWFSLVISPDDYFDFSVELENLLKKYALQEVYMKCMFCLCLESEIELYFYNKRQLTKYCEEINKKFYLDYNDEDTKVQYYKTVI